MKTEILFMKQEDVIEAGILDMAMVLEMVEKAFYLEGQGEIINPPKTVFGIPIGQEPSSKFFSMPVYIGGDVNRPGIKWAAESRANARPAICPWNRPGDIERPGDCAAGSHHGRHGDYWP